jgi:hypothetical protein
LSGKRLKHSPYGEHTAASVGDGSRRAGGIYVWELRADADRVYTAEWKAFVQDKYGAPLSIEYLQLPVMVDNAAGTISVAA